MTEYWIEPSGENPALARAETDGAALAVGGEPSDDAPRTTIVGWSSAELPGDAAAVALGRRLALAWRIVRPWPPLSDQEAAGRFRIEGRSGRSASFRPFGRAAAPLPADADGLPRAYVEGGGRISLGDPERRYFLGLEGDGRWTIAESIHEIDRRESAARRMPTLPFRRPVSLPPKLGRVAVNLAAVRSGDRVVDPFVGTGALALEAAVVGAEVVGIDRDPAMVRGAVQNLEARGFAFASVVAADAGSEAALAVPGEFDAVVTDPPYGRSSSSGGEEPAALLARILPAWAARVRSGGRVVVVVPGGPDPLSAPWRRIASIPDRVHGSLTREFRIYSRATDGAIRS